VAITIWRSSALTPARPDDPQAEESTGIIQRQEFMSDDGTEIVMTTVWRRCTKTGDQKRTTMLSWRDACTVTRWTAATA
jgi:hypothetical protein